MVVKGYEIGPYPSRRRNSNKGSPDERLSRIPGARGGLIC